MSVNYALSGLSDPGTAVEFAGTVYFFNNVSDTNYVIDKAMIEGGKLIVDFTPVDDLRPNRLRALERHFFKLAPNRDGRVGLTVKECGEPNRDGKTHVIIYRVESMSTPARGEYFRFRKYEADLNIETAMAISCSIDRMKLVNGYGFICTSEHDDDGKRNTSVYSRKEQ